ncbi:MAG: B3/4 domain-containing protein [Burkholderiales bacterium]|jgi:DNA/RNA-binding domain of Phe-tRNA-synthetase-like protein
MELAFEIAPSLAGRVRIGLVGVAGTSVREGDPALAAEVDAECLALRARYGEGKSSEVPGAADARTLYKALGIDPTKTRPSNEALLRRALKGEGLYRINTLVDALNLASLREQLPFGLYDLDRVRPPVTLRLGGEAESYEGIRKGPVQVAGRPVLVDAEGPFGNPTSDSLRTSITLATTRCLAVAYAPASYSPARLDDVLDRTAATLVRACGGEVVLRRRLP